MPLPEISVVRSEIVENLRGRFANFLRGYNTASLHYHHHTTTLIYSSFLSSSSSNSRPRTTQQKEKKKLSSIAIMAKTKKELLASAPWREGPLEDEKFKDAKMKVTSQPGTTPTMHVPGKKKFSSKNHAVGEDSLTEIDPELRYSFQRNFQVNFKRNSLIRFSRFLVSFCVLLYSVCVLGDLSWMF